MPGDKNLGVALSRTITPNLPSDYLSRRHLFPLIDNDPSGTTFLIAPGGYGKTTLVSEWAQNQQNSVIWMTITQGDSLNEMSAMMIFATRHVIPDFASWFEKEQPVRPTDLVRRWGNELLQTGRDFVFVLDYLNSSDESEIDISVQLIEQFPRNVHFIVIRRTINDALYATCASRGPIKSISINELRFSEEEIERYAKNSGIEQTASSLKFLQSAHGWPSATSLLRAHLQRNGADLEIERIINSTIEPLRALAMIVIKNLGEEINSLCSKLSVLPTFTLDQAKIILGEQFSYDLINSIAVKGEIFSISRDPQVGYQFSPMVREVFLEILRRNIQLKNDIHNQLINYFEVIGRPSLAIEHAFLCENVGKIGELFPTAARIKQAQGRGGELIRWSSMAGDNTPDSNFKIATVRTAGFLADLDFASAQAEIAKLKLVANDSPLRDFFLQFSEAASMYAALTLGRFQEVEERFIKGSIGLPECLLGAEDQINVMRLLATKRYIWNEAAGVKEVFEKAQKIAEGTTLNITHASLNAIHAMHLHQQGDYRRAYEIAMMTRQQIEQGGFVGNHGPLDVMYVTARVLLEFSQTDEAIKLFEEIQGAAFQWKQWHWRIASDDNICQYISFYGNPRDALLRIKEARTFIETLDPNNQLEVLIDINEMNVRRKLNDFDTLEKLVNRAPNIRNTQHFRMVIEEQKGRKIYPEIVRTLPSDTPRDQIWKYLSEASLNIDSENMALPPMRKAMQIGAEVGARETFLRQNDQIGNLIIKIANDFPTVYNEELAAKMAQRMHERGAKVSVENQSLTKREQEILRQLSTGRTLTTIAGELHISQNTMKTHLKNLYKKLGAENRSDAVEKAKALFLL